MTTEPPVSIPWPRLGVFALLSISLAVALGGSLTHQGTVMENGKIVVARELVFQDRADGALVALSAADQRPVEVFTGENGFIRGTLRGFARVRRADNISPAMPFRLARWSDGRLTLDDAATGRHVELLAFGPDNFGVFAELLQRAL